MFIADRDSDSVFIIDYYDSYTVTNINLSASGRNSSRILFDQNI